VSAERSEGEMGALAIVSSTVYKVN